MNKKLSLSLRLTLLALAPLLTQCVSSGKKKSAPAPAVLTAAPSPKTQAKADAAPPPAEAKADATAAGDDYDDLDEYAVEDMADPLEKINRATFWFNDKVYLCLFGPLSKGYEKLLPKPVRNGIDNAFENARYPVRVVNSALQGKFKRVGQHTEKFLLNTVCGVGGLIRVSDKFPTLAELPDEDTGKTFAKWGMGHGAYIVIPILGPSSVRDGTGLLADYAMNPVNWGVYWYGKYDWTSIPPSVNTLRVLPVQLATYNDTKRDAIDPYIAIRSGYLQFRQQAVSK